MSLLVGMVAGLVVGVLVHRWFSSQGRTADTLSVTSNLIPDTVKLHSYPNVSTDDTDSKAAVEVEVKAEVKKVASPTVSKVTQDTAGLGPLVTLANHWLVNNKTALIEKVNDQMKSAKSRFNLLDIEEGEKALEVDHVTLVKTDLQRSSLKVMFHISLDSIKFSVGPAKTRLKKVSVAGHAYIDMTSSGTWPFVDKVQLLVDKSPNVDFLVSNKIKSTVIGGQFIRSKVKSVIANWVKHVTAITLYESMDQGPKPSMPCMFGVATKRGLSVTGEDQVDGLDYCDLDTTSTPQPCDPNETRGNGHLFTGLQSDCIVSDDTIDGACVVPDDSIDGATSYRGQPDDSDPWETLVELFSAASDTGADVGDVDDNNNEDYDDEEEEEIKEDDENVLENCRRRHVVNDSCQ